MSLSDHKGTGVSFALRGPVICVISRRVLQTGCRCPSLPLQRGGSAKTSGAHSELLPRPRVVSITHRTDTARHTCTRAPITTEPFSHTHKDTFCLFDHRMEFTIGKLRRSGNHQGLYILRCSPRDYDKYFMSFVVGVSC